MGKQSFKGVIRDIVCYLSWKLFLWAVRMTDEEYWNYIYKAERNRRCVDNPVR